MNICRRALSTRLPSYLALGTQQRAQQASTTKKVYTVGDQLLAQGARGRPDATGTALLIDFGNSITFVTSAPARDESKQKHD